MKAKTLVVAAALISTPLSTLAAQEPDPAAQGMEEVEALAAELANLFPSDPLTAEQEARLPQAEAVVARIFPPGTYARMMDETMEPMMEAIMGSMQRVPLAQLAAIGGLDESDVAEMGDARLGEVLAILDPAHEQRNAIFAQVTSEMVGALMQRIEPSYRAGLARAYAVRFERSDLVELDRFFQTPTGGRYAAESMLIFADPQVMSAMNEVMPAVLEMMPAMIENLQERSAQLPEPRRLFDLTDDEIERLSRLLGVPVEDVRAAAASDGKGHE